MPKIAVLLLSILLAAVLTACGSDNGLAKDKINVVTSFYTLYDFAAKIGGDHVNVINLVPAGVEPHDWSPKSKDVVRINKAQLFIYQGAGFEGWTDDFLKSKKKEGSLVIEASKGVDFIAADGEHQDSGHADERHNAVDPHAWLSPRNAKTIAANIRDGLIASDPAHKADYEANFATLSGRLDELDGKFREQLASTARKDIVVSHQAFAYLCRDYGLTQKAIMGLSPDAEPTAQEMKSINDFIKANQVRYVFFEELVSDKLAKTLARDAGIETLVLNPLEGMTDKEIKAGEDYISVMESNLQNLKKALQ